MGLVIVKNLTTLVSQNPKCLNFQMRILIVDRSEGHLQSWSVLPIGQVS